MSGHSKWSKVKHVKAVKDARKGKLFSKLVKNISIVAGFDPNPETNAALRLAIEQAKRANVPSVTIERALSKADKLRGGRGEFFQLEGVGPGGVALLIEVATDNRNRTVAQLRHLLEEKGGRLAEKGSLLWQFNRQAQLVCEGDLSDNEELQLIDCQAEDIKRHNQYFIILSSVEAVTSLRRCLERLGKKITKEQIIWLAQDKIELTDGSTNTQLKQLVEKLENHSDVLAVYSNAKLS